MDEINNSATTAVHLDSKTTYGGFWIRFLALIIDGILISIATAPLGQIIGSDPFYTKAASLYSFPGLLRWGVNVAYFSIMNVYFGATVGKMVLGLKVVDTSGQRLDWGKAILREVVGKFVSGIVFGLGFLWVAFDGKKQGWHDKIAKTYVVKKS